MGHTHYYEVANDGTTLYTATRSTGQIEEGPVGFSVTNVDGDVVSWAFLPLTQPSLVLITTPADERFVTASTITTHGPLTIRAKFWGTVQGVTLHADIGGHRLPMLRVGNSQVWQTTLPGSLPNGIHQLTVIAQPASGPAVEDRIQVRVGPAPPAHRAPRDQDNALAAWPARGLLGTQLGPNKNGKKW